MADDKNWWAMFGLDRPSPDAAEAEPPVALLLDPPEVEALALAARLMARSGDPALAAAARRALVQLAGTVDPERRAALGLGDDFAVDVREGRDAAMPAIALAMRRRRVLRLLYRDALGRETARTVWPIALVIFDHARILAAWCELRSDHRHLRLDRMIGAHVGFEAIPHSRKRLLADWRRTVDWMVDRPMTT
jgi:predicted DNA-binding transcriptional regulator YafY